MTETLSIFFIKFRTKLPLQLRTTAFSRLKELQGKLELAIATAKMSDGDRLGLERLKSCEDNSKFCHTFRNRPNPLKSGDEGPLVVINDVTDIDDHSHSESDWENEFTHEGRAGSESGAESGTGGSYPCNLFFSLQSASRF